MAFIFEYMVFSDLGSLGLNYPKYLKSLFPLDSKVKTAAQFSDYFAMILKHKNVDFWLEISFQEVLFLFKLFFFTGKWNTIFQMIEKTVLSKSWWHFILLVNTDDIENATIIKKNLVFPIEPKTTDDWEIIGYVIQYLDMKGHFEDIEGLLVQFNLNNIQYLDISNYPDGILTVLHNLASVKLNQGHFNDAYEIITKCEIESAKRQHNFWLSQAYSKKGFLYIQQGKVQEAIELLNLSIKLSKQLNDSVGLLLRYNNLGIGYKSINDFDSALNCFNKALELKSTKEVPEIYIKKIQARIAAILIIRGEFKEAEKILKPFLHFSRERRYTLGILYSLNHLGIINSDLGDLSLSIDYYKEGLVLAKAKSSFDYQARFLNNLGWTYFKKGKFQEAFSYYKEALDVFKKLKNKKEVARVNSNIAITYYNLGDYLNTKEYLSKSLTQFHELKSPRGEMLCNFIFVDNFLAQGNYIEAEKICLNALTIAKQLEEALQVAYGYGKLGEVQYYLSSKTASSHLQKGIDIYLQYEAYDLQYAHYLFIQLNLLAEDKKWKRFKKTFKLLRELDKKLQSNSLDYYIRYSELILKKEEGSLFEINSQLKQLSNKALGDGFFPFYIKCNLSSIQVQIQMKHFTEVQPTIKDLLKLAKLKNLKPLIASCYYLLGLFDYYQFNFKSAISIIEDNIRFCETNKLFRELKLIKESKSIIEEDTNTVTELYKSMKTDDKSILEQKVRNLSEKLIHAFVSNELRIFVPEKYGNMLDI